MKNSAAFKKMVLIFLPLAIGSLIYLLFRPTHLLVFELFRYTGTLKELMRIRSQLEGIGEKLPCWIIFSLPNALWTFSMSEFFIYVWKTIFRARYWLFLTWSISLCFEVFQLIGVIPGTFSIIDLIFIIAAILISLIINRTN